MTKDKDPLSENDSGNAAYPLPDSPECPFCGGTETHLENPFGSVLSVAQYYCRRCRTIFEWIKRDNGMR